jgi:hypothetical protein
MATDEGKEYAFTSRRKKRGDPTCRCNSYDLHLLQLGLHMLYSINQYYNIRSVTTLISMIQSLFESEEF